MLYICKLGCRGCLRWDGAIERAVEPGRIDGTGDGKRGNLDMTAYYGSLPIANPPGLDLAFVDVKGLTPNALHSGVSMKHSYSNATTCFIALVLQMFEIRCGPDARSKSGEIT
jgi:hypothetical protein